MKKAIGTLGRLLANSDSRSLERTRNRMLLAMKIEAAMRKKGFTCAQFAKKIGRTENEISEWLSGDYDFSIDTLTDIELTLGIHLLNTPSYETVFIYTKMNSEVSSVSASKYNWSDLPLGVNWHLCK